MSNFNNNNNSAINANTAKNRKKKAKKKAKKQNITDSSNTPSELSTPNLTDKENIDPSPFNGKTSLNAASLLVSPTEHDIGGKSNSAIITDAQTTPANTDTLSGEASAIASSLPAAPIEDTTNVGGNNNTAIITDIQTTPANTDTLSGEASAIASSLPAAPIEDTTNVGGNNNTAIITDAQTTPANTDILSGEASAIASSLPAAPIEDTTNVGGNNNTATITDAQTTPAGTSTLSGEGSAIASSLPAKAIDESHGTNSQTTSSLPNEPIEGSIHDSNIPAAGPVGPGAHGATAAGAAAVAATVGTTATAAATTTTTTTTTTTGSTNTGRSGGTASLPEPLPLSDNVKYEIKSVIASRSIDLYGIVDRIRNNVAVGDYKEKAKLPPNANTIGNQSPQVPTSVNTDADINPKAAVCTPNNAPAAITSNNDSNKSTIKKAVAGVGAAVAGASAAVAGTNKSKNVNTNATTTDNTSTINKAPAPPPPTSSSSTTTYEAPKLSESVQYCIKSVVQAPSVDVYGIIKSSQKVKRPEAAVGSNTQPTMPSSAKAPDVPKKPIKSPENRNKPSFLKKKKNCIIL